MILRDTNIKRALLSRQAPRRKQRGFLLNPYNFGAPQTPGDPHWSETSSLMHFDGVNDGDVFTDEKGKVWTKTGTVVTKTSPAVFDQSAYFSGVVGSALTAPSSADFTFGTGDFCIEVRSYCIDAGTNRGIFSFDNNRTLYYASNGSFYFYDGSSNILGGVSSVYNTWQAFALVREAGVLSLYINETRLASVSFTANITSTNMVLGNNTVNSAVHYGYLDEFRCTKGVARISGSSYTVSASPFPNYA